MTNKIHQCEWNMTRLFVKEFDFNWNQAVIYCPPFRHEGANKKMPTKLYIKMNETVISVAQTVHVRH